MSIVRPLLARAGPAAFAAALVAMGYAGAGRQMAKGAVPGVVEGLSDRALQEKVVASVDPEVVERATERIAAGVVDGTLDTLADPERLGRVQTFVAAGMEPVGRSVGAAVAGAFDATVTRLLGPEAQAELRLLARQLAVDAVTELVRSVGRELGTKEREAAFGALARTVAREATFGFQDAIDQSRRGEESGPTPQGGGNVLAAMGDAAALGRNVLWVGGALVAVLLLGLVAVIVLLVRPRRPPGASSPGASPAGRSSVGASSSGRSSSGRSSVGRSSVGRSSVGRSSVGASPSGREASLWFLAQAIRSAPDEPWVGALREALAAALRDEKGAALRHAPRAPAVSGAEGVGAATNRLS